MIDGYILSLKEKLVGVEEIKNNNVLNRGAWNKGSYDTISQLIYQKLNLILSHEIKLQIGTTISPRTLYNIFEFKRKINFPLDQRVLNTLNKISMFADMDSWDSFVSYVDSEKADAHLSEEDVTNNELTRFINKVKEVEYLCYHGLPEYDISILEECYMQDSSAFKEIVSNLHELSQIGWVISNPFNPSSIDLLSIDTEPVNGDKYHVKTQEYWILCWYDLQSKKFVKRQKEMQEHIYVVQKCSKSGKWKIITNASSGDVL